MSEREVSEKEIEKKLEEIIENILAPKEVRLLAKLIFNIRYDIDELKAELLKVFKEDEEPESIKKGDDNTGELYS